MFGYMTDLQKVEIDEDSFKEIECSGSRNAIPSSDDLLRLESGFTSLQFPHNGQGMTCTSAFCFLGRAAVCVFVGIHYFEAGHSDLF